MRKGRDVFRACSATEIEAYNIKCLLQRYVSSVPFSVGCSSGEGFGKYLGIQSYFGASKKKVFEESVAATLPIYTMSCFQLPIQLAKEIEQIIARFWWRDQKTKRGVHWLTWKKVAKRKASRGLGFKEIIDFNLAMLAKVGWRLICNPESLLDKVFRAKYYPNSLFLEALVGRGTSWGWKGILQGRKILKIFQPISRHLEIPKMVADMVCIGGTWKHEVIESVVFKKIVVEPNEIMGSDEDPLPYKVLGQSRRGTILYGWIKSRFGIIKINCDGAWCNPRDFAGIFKGAGGVGKVLCGLSIMAEAEALMMDVMASVERGFGSVHLETDSKVLVDMIHRKLQPEATMETILWDINTIKRHLCSIEFLYTPCACNEVVHHVASYVTHVGGVHSWDEFEPEWLFNSLAYDVNISIRI
ncbi:ribonuclease H protein [Pyrus ussuriensis x Pyrus communis]|uniref:Ribonuclease H protein n=1 Tax=Pyrus ussuriensis x Pyrus communis TaxID=2448454 RepID=A0A5N5HEM3_9ROSA|nr:ribonuclease H protein [Pyrus ussuriensis x Pyrus communis]